MKDKGGIEVTLKQVCIYLFITWFIHTLSHSV